MTNIEKRIYRKEFDLNIVHELCVGCPYYEPIWMICKFLGKPCETITECERNLNNEARE